MRVVRGFEQVLADQLRPFWQVYIVVVPKRHIASLLSLDPDDVQLVRELLGERQAVAALVLTQHGAGRVLTNLGAYQDSKHLHVHVSAGEPLHP